MAAMREPPFSEFWPIFAGPLVPNLIALDGGIAMETYSGQACASRVACPPSLTQNPSLPFASQEAPIVRPPSLP